MIKPGVDYYLTIENPSSDTITNKLKTSNITSRGGSSTGNTCHVSREIDSCNELPRNTKDDNSVPAGKKVVYHFKVNEGEGYSVTAVGFATSDGGKTGHRFYIGISETPGESRFTPGENPACYSGPAEWPVVNLHTLGACVVVPGVDYYVTLEDTGMVAGKAGFRISTNGI